MQPLGASGSAMMAAQAVSTSAHVAGGSVIPASFRMSMLLNITVDDVFHGIE